MPKVFVTDSFARSVELEYDYYAGKRVDSYLVTAKARELLGRFESTVASRNGGAFSIIGTYGSGKSAFALYCAALLSGWGRSRSDGPQSKLAEADRPLSEKIQATFSKPLLPVLITGRRESIASSVLRALESTGERFKKSSADSGLWSEWLRSVKKELKSPLFMDQNEVMRLIEDLSLLSRNEGYDGIFIVIDELGKLLEYAALNTRDSDVYLLQLIAEKCVRRGENDPKILFLTISHQAVDRYATRLATTQQEEWRKVQGRFEDFAFIEPVNETTRLLAAAITATLSPKELQVAERRAANVLQNIEIPSHIDKNQLETQLVGSAPLSPFVSLAVGPLFRRLAQNERSLFAFLSSSEPGGFISVVNDAKEGTAYELHHLYDYLMATVGPTLMHGRDSRYWSEVETVLLRADGKTPHQIDLIKTIAMLGYVGQQIRAKVDQATLSSALGFNLDQIETDLEALISQKLITFRRLDEEYVIWQGSDFDIDEWLRKARAEVSDQVSVAELLASASDLTPVIARRHAYRTGTFRYFEPKYVSASNWFIEAQKPSKWADGKIVYVVSTSQEERRVVRQSLAEKEISIDPSNVVSLLPDASHIRDTAYDVLCYEWIYNNCSELAGDPSARRELSQRRIDTSAYLESELKRLVFSSDELSSNWYFAGSFCEVKSPRDRQQRLSQLCDDLFSESPGIWSELLNRRKPSSSATSGLKSLLSAMLNHPQVESLGIEGTPVEYGLYESILRKGNLHKPDLGFTTPNEAEDVLHVLPLFEAWNRVLLEANAERRSIGVLQKMANDAPFGLRQGLFLPLVFAFILQRQSEIALYEDDALLIDVGPYEIDRLVKDASRFSIQMIRVDTDRKQLLEVYGEVVGVDKSELTILRVVMELIRKVRKLNPYARRTGNLASRDTAVREALFRAEDPIRLLFHDLPEACGFESELNKTHPKDYQTFGLALEASLRSITNSYNALLLDLQDQMAAALLLRSGRPEERRTELVERSRPLLEYATNDHFRAFLVRATDAVMDTPSWFESLAALLAESPPKHWIDKDKLEFDKNLNEIARSYQTLEPLVFEQQSEGALNNSDTVGRRRRVSVTSLGADEKARVISVHPEDEDLVARTAQKLRDVLSTVSEGRNEVFRLAVLAELAEIEMTEEHKPESKTRK